MKWPKYITIRRERWKVRLVGRNEFSTRSADADVFGETWDFEKEIRIWRGLKEKARWVTLLHELIHVASIYANGSDGVSLGMEHALIIRLQEPLFEIMHNNFGFGKEEEDEK